MQLWRITGCQTVLRVWTDYNLRYTTQHQYRAPITRKLFTFQTWTPVHNHYQWSWLLNQMAHAFSIIFSVFNLYMSCLALMLAACSCYCYHKISLTHNLCRHLHWNNNPTRRALTELPAHFHVVVKTLKILQKYIAHQIVKWGTFQKYTGLWNYAYMITIETGDVMGQPVSTKTSTWVFRRCITFGFPILK